MLAPSFLGNLRPRWSTKLIPFRLNYTAVAIIREVFLRLRMAKTIFFMASW